MNKIVKNTTTHFCPLFPFKLIWVFCLFDSVLTYLVFIRDHPEYGKILTLAIGCFIKLSSDETLQVWSVADECLLTVIKVSKKK